MYRKLLAIVIRLTLSFEGKDVKSEGVIPSPVSLVAEEKVSFGLYALSVSSLTVARIRKVYNKLDSKAIAKQVSGMLSQFAVMVFTGRVVQMGTVEPLQSPQGPSEVKPNVVEWILLALKMKTRVHRPTNAGEKTMGSPQSIQRCQYLPRPPGPDLSSDLQN